MSFSTHHLLPLFLASLSVALAADPSPLPTAAFLKDCAFVSVDIQEAGERSHMTPEQLPKEWVRMGIKADDVNKAIDYAFDTAFPNSRRVVEACRAAGLPMIFIHWGCLFPDGMDLDPAIRQSFLAEHGTNYEKWGHHLCDASAQPAKFLGIRPGEYVIPKTAQDGFTSSNLDFVLKNLGVKRLIMIGGHTGACLGRTAASAKQRGYELLCVEDATFDARDSTRRRYIDETGYNYVVTTDQLLAWLQAAKPADVKPAAAKAN